ncbi:MAG: HEAT repeat domain-containing protein [Actinomycetota bacterium]|nr:HEAT repeat domain-containing protein [Actinomycetota bacterium]
MECKRAGQDDDGAYAGLQQIADDPEALVEKLDRVRAEDSSSDLATTIVMALRAHGSSEIAMGALEDILRRDESWYLRSTAATVLSEIGTQRALELLAVAAEDEDKRVSDNAGWRLKQRAPTGSR